MKFRQLLFLFSFALLTAGMVQSQPPQRYERVLVGPAESRQTMNPVVRGTQYAAASMASQATMAAERILRAAAMLLMPLLPARQSWRWWMRPRTALEATRCC